MQLCWQAGAQSCLLVGAQLCQLMGPQPLAAQRFGLVEAAQSCSLEMALAHYREEAPLC